ncbi:MAG: hypothetical protein OES26_26905 [Gammaproteobacteria bacterium]|nr:hypothetical protein [Gammaproteobacteria bacterium]
MPHEPMFQTAAFEVIVKFPLYILRQYRAPGGQMGGKRRVMLFDDFVKKCLFRLVALIAETA